MATQAGVELGTESVTECCYGGGQTSLEGVVDGSVVGREGGGGNPRCNKNNSLPTLPCHQGNGLGMGHNQIPEP